MYSQCYMLCKLLVYLYNSKGLDCCYRTDSDFLPVMSPILKFTQIIWHFWVQIFCRVRFCYSFAHGWSYWLQCRFHFLVLVLIPRTLANTCPQIPCPVLALPCPYSTQSQHLPSHTATCPSLESTLTFPTIARNMATCLVLVSSNQTPPFTVHCTCVVLVSSPDTPHSQHCITCSANQ